MSKQPSAPHVSGRNGGAFKIALSYLTIGALWILLSDTVAARFASNEAVLTQISIYKGWGYVLVSTLLLYWMIRNHTQKISQTELTLSASEKNYQELLQQASDGIFIADANGRYTFVNEEACKLVGYTKEELLAMNLRELIAPEDLGKTPLRLDELHVGKTLITERKLLRKDGLRIVCEISAKQLPDGRYQSILRDVTERKLTEHALRRSEKRFRSLFENMIDGFARCQMIYENGIPHDFVYLDVNDSFKTMTGLQNVIGKRVSEVMPGIRESNPELFEIYGRVALTGKPEKFETHVPGLGAGIWFAVSVYSTEKEFFVTLFETITERKLAEAALCENEERLRLSLHAANQGLYDLNVQTGDAVVNREYAEMLGYDADTFVETNAAWVERLHPDDRDVTAKAYSNYINGLTPEYRVEFRQKTKAGEWKWILSLGKVIEYDPDGKPLRMLGTHTDITDRKRAEEALRQSQENFAKAFNSNPAAIAITRLADGKFINFNAAYTAIMGYEPHELLGHTTAEMNIYVHAEERGQLVRQLRKQGKIQNYELAVRVKSGATRNILMSMEPILYNEEECILSVFIDISERQKMEAELLRSNAELEQFAYVASHDLQEPLRAVAGMVQLLQQRYQGKLDEGADEYIGHAVDASTRMQTLINDLLEYSRLERFGKPMAETDLESCLKNARANLQVAIQESHAQITHAPLPMVKADAVQLTQVLQNLIGNAIKFRGARPLHIHMDAKKLEHCWQFEVSDNGIGIEPQYFERIFQVFQRLHTRREYPGTGIGLSLCKKIIERHGGQIWLESQPGAGSTFYFTLPESL